MKLVEAIKVDETLIPIDPLQLFQRIAISNKSDAELQMYLQFELSPIPLSLFNEHGMRKTQKSSLYRIFEETPSTEINLCNTWYVLDGGFLLHRVVWQQQQTFHGICNAYISYVRKHYGSSATIVFDGYDENATSTKSAERQRRYLSKDSADIIFSENTTVSIGQEKFLSNEKKKSRLIAVLSEAFEKESFPVKMSKGDADTLIVSTGIEKSMTGQTVVVGEDVDLLVLLIAYAQPSCDI